MHWARNWETHDPCGSLPSLHILLFCDSEILEIRILWNTISCPEVEWADSAGCHNCYSVPGVISYASLTAVVDVPGVVCTTTCKSVQVRENVLELREILRIIFSVLQYHLVLGIS